ncbi:MAG: hypothetical protein C0518_15555 [Opitutus sp.]|nr:hypothetical protein [Opitutus sp.]
MAGVVGPVHGFVHSFKLLVEILTPRRPIGGILPAMKIRALLAFVLLAFAVGANDGRAAPATYASDQVSAFWGRYLLGKDTWSRVVRVDNARPTARYPAAFYGLVFELEGILWFYTETEGTQSLSRSRGRIGRDRAEFRELVQTLSPGFTAVADVTDESPPLFALIDNRLPRGCFLFSVLNWRRLESKRLGYCQPRLLTYYVATPEGPRGHTVLIYRGGKRTFLYDSASESLEQEIGALDDDDPLGLATRLASSALPPVSASFLQMHRTGYRVKEPRIIRRSLPTAAVLGAP